jgi:quinol monooxygenase YgiN
VAPEGKRDELLEVLSGLRGPTEVSRGCRGCRIVQDVDEQNALTYFVEWESQGDLEENLRSERFRRILPYIEMSAEPPEVTFSIIDKVEGIEFLIETLSSNSIRTELGH